MTETTYPREVGCAECKLPSVKGMPPLVRSADKLLRHVECPYEPENVLKLIENQAVQRAEFIKRMTTSSKHVVSYHTDKDGNVVRTVVA